MRRFAKQTDEAKLRSRPSPPDTVKDISKAIQTFEIAAENGKDFAEYQLGKIHLYGKKAEQDYDKAIAYLTASAEHGNHFAKQRLYSIKSNRNWSAAKGT